MKRYIYLVSMVLLTLGTFAQKMSYQAVVRNSAGELVRSDSLRVVLSVLNASNATQYSETHNNVTSNENGLISLMIGDGTVNTGIYANINWTDAKIKTEIFSNKFGLITVNISNLHTVPVALYADKTNVTAEDIENVFSSLTEQQFDDMMGQLLKRYLARDHYVINTNRNCADEIDACNIVNTIHNFGDTLAEYLTDRNYFVNNVSGGISQFMSENDIFIQNIKDTIADYLAEHHYITNTNTACADEIDACNIANAMQHFGDTLAEYLTDRSYFVNNISGGISQFMSENDIFIQNIKDTIADYLAEHHYVTNSNSSCADEIDACEIANTIQHFGDTLAEYLTNRNYFVNNVSDSISQYVSENDIFMQNIKDTIADYLAQHHYVTNTNTACADVIDACYVATTINFRDSIATYLAANHYVTNTNTACADEIDACIVSNVSNLEDSIANYLASKHYVVNNNSASSDTINTYIVNNFRDTLGGYLRTHNYVVNTGPCEDDIDVCGILSEPIVKTNTCRSGLGGEVLRNGGMPVTQRGICWSTQPNPTISNSHTTNGSGSGVFESEMQGLEENTTYYYRAYAINSVGVGYGQLETLAIPLSTDGTSCGTVTDHQGNSYNTVRIGNQCWTKENMRCTTSPNGYLTNGGSDSSFVQPYYYDLNTSVSIPLNERGLFYNWLGALDTVLTEAKNISFTNRRGICPEGWHIPTRDEFETLISYVHSLDCHYRCGENTSSISKALASKNYWQSANRECTPGNNPSENNATGLNVVPAGRSRGDQVIDRGKDATIWSSTSRSENYSFYFSLYHDRIDFAMYSGLDKDRGRSVRCIKNS